MKFKPDISIAEYRALCILRAWPEGITAKWFASKMWPDSPNWKKHYRVGHGTTIGAGMWMAGGSYLRKLQKKGFVYREYSYGGFLYVLKHTGDRALEKCRNQIYDYRLVDYKEAVDDFRTGKTQIKVFIEKARGPRKVP